MQLTPLALLLLAPVLPAQSGLPDQFSPADGTNLAVGSPGNVWQQEVRAGIKGQLEGFEITTGGVLGGEFILRVRKGDGWNLGPVLWSTNVVDPTPSIQVRYFDVTSAGVLLEKGEAFVIEAQGVSGLLSILGKYIPPSSGPPSYPDELYLNAACYADCGYRQGFQTWMLPELGENYCQAVPNSTGDGALITATGTTSIAANDLILLASNVPNQPGIFYYGPNQVQVPFGDGMRCVGGVVGRLPVENGLGNTLTHALDITQPPSGLVVIGAGSTWNFQAWFRDPAAGGSGFNLSNGLELSFLP